MTALEKAKDLLSHIEELVVEGYTELKMELKKFIAEIETKPEHESAVLPPEVVAGDLDHAPAVPDPAEADVQEQAPTDPTPATDAPEGL